MPRITTVCICIYVFGCRLSLFRLCDSDFGIIPVAEITIGTACTASCFHITRTSFASSWYFIIIIIIIKQENVCWHTTKSVLPAAFSELSISTGKCAGNGYATVPPGYRVRKWKLSCFEQRLRSVVSGPSEGRKGKPKFHNEHPAKFRPGVNWSSVAVLTTSATKPPSDRAYTIRNIISRQPGLWRHSNTTLYDNTQRPSSSTTMATWSAFNPGLWRHSKTKLQCNPGNQIPIQTRVVTPLKTKRDANHGSAWISQSLGHTKRHHIRWMQILYFVGPSIPLYQAVAPPSA
jgi:hypothetical protein